MAGFQVITFTETDGHVQEYKRRKVHNKTRLGCVECRAKRVKCDERKPTCLRCERNDRVCKYGESPPPAATSPTTIPSPTFASASADSSIPAFLLQHLDRDHVDILCMPLQDSVVKMFHSSPLVRQAILALTAAHLDYRSPGRDQYRMTLLSQRSAAFTSHHNCLNSPIDSQEKANQVFLSAIFMNTLAFMLPSEESTDPGASWLFSDDSDRLDWLSLQSGLRPLVMSMLDYVSKTMDFLAPLFIGRETKRFVFPMTHGLEVVPANWLNAFGYDASNDSTSCDASSSEDVYRPPLIIAALLRKLEPHPHNIFHNITFLSKIYRPFRGLLYDRDVKAIWLFGYWLGLMCRYDNVWWAELRVKRDYEAVKLWLRMSGIAERDQLWNELICELEGVYTPR